MSPSFPSFSFSSYLSSLAFLSSPLSLLLYLLTHHYFRCKWSLGSGIWRQCVALERRGFLRGRPPSEQLCNEHILNLPHINLQLHPSSLQPTSPSSCCIKQHFKIPKFPKIWIFENKYRHALLRRRNNKPKVIHLHSISSHPPFLTLHHYSFMLLNDPYTFLRPWSTCCHILSHPYL